MPPRKDVPDVCIVGSGLAGALMAYDLGLRGMKVVVIEAGPRHDPNHRYSYMQQSLRGNNPWVSDNPERDRYANGGPIDYSLNEYRVKAVGGSTLHWGGVADRLHETDFKMRSLYGIAEDWPVSYEELEPYYGRAERALGVAGIADNAFASYRSTGFPLPHFPFSHGDRLVEQACRRLGISLHHVPCARNSVPYQDGPACQAFATCGSFRVCPIAAQYTAERHIVLAERTGNVVVVPNTSVTRIDTDASGRAISAHCIDHEKREHEQRARTFVVAAHAVESARLLLLSRSSRFPDGLANGSGMVGKNFMEHLYMFLMGTVKENVGPHRIGFHTAESHQYCHHDKRASTGSFKIAFYTGGPTPVELASASANWGPALQEEVRERFGKQLAIAICLEQLPTEANAISLDASIKDSHGSKVPRITYSMGEYETEAGKKGIEIVKRIFTALDATDVRPIRGPIGGYAVAAAHHMGTCRMGNDPNRSVVNRFLQAHEVSNLYIVGSSVFVTGSSKSPSLTIAALAIRAAEHIVKTRPS